MTNSINTNIAAYFAQANITSASQQSTESVARLSSGNAIVEASDNVAALAIGNSLTAEVAALTAAGTNASQGTSLLEVADGSLAQIGSILNQQNSIALQAASGSLTDTDRGFLNQQFAALTNEINSLATGTTFNGVQLLDGSIAAAGSANPLENAANTLATAAVTVGGFQPTTNSPAYGTVNFTGFNDESGGGSAPFYGVDTNGTTQYSGFTASGNFAASTVIAGPVGGGNDHNLFGALDVGGTIGGNGTTLSVTQDNGNNYDITYTADGVAYTGVLASTSGLGGTTNGETVTLTNAGSPGTHGTITFTTNGAYASGDFHTQIAAALSANLATAVGYNAFFNQAPTITQPTSGNDPDLDGALSGGLFAVSANGTIGGTATSYSVSYTLNGITYQGNLANDGSNGHAEVSAGQTVTLTATQNPLSHATITLTVGSDIIGSSQTVDQSTNIQATLTNQFNGATGYSAGFIAPSANGGLEYLAPTNTASDDTALYGDLSGGVVSITANGSGVGNANMTGYTVNYTLNGVTYQGTLANASNGSGEVSTGTSLELQATSNTSQHASIFLKTGTQAFGISASVDQSNNIKAALQAFVTGASVLTTTQDATVTGQVAQTGIGLVSAQNDVGKNDTAFVGDLSAGTFTVTGNTTNGYAVSYVLGGSTYQGSLTAGEIAGGGNLVLDNGKGTLSFAITASTALAPNASTATASALQTALTSQFAAATAFADHQVITTNATDTNGLAIAGSAIPTQTTGVLAGFSGNNVTLQSALFSGVNLPSVATFTGTGSGTSTVFSVVINGTTYQTAGAVTDNTTLQASQFNGATAGHLTFYANGDTSSKEQLTLNLSAVTGTADIDTTANVQNIATALNTAFGSGGSSGGLEFQLGSTSGSNVAVTIGSARTTALYGGQTLNIGTQAGATAAAAQISTAINTVTALRAGVGALESQFNFAAAALQTSTQNQQAAAGQFLDTNIASESTNFATEQVKLQAGISVLAQANQQLQALLKLIG